MKDKKFKNILSKFKNRRLITAYIISFVLVFMLYFYEPITMYLNNVNDFWFNLNIIIWPLIKINLLLFLSLSIIFTVIYFVNKKINDKTLIFDICLVAFFIGFLCSYIQGNFLANNLPPLDGTSIDWFSKEYLSQNIISIVMWILISIITILLTIKFKRERIIKCISYVTIAIFAMLLASFVSVVFTKNDVSKKGNSIIVTSKNIENVSTDKNFFIFVVDATDSVIFEEEMNKNEKYKEMFNDFTYYKDTMSVYPFTRDSIPILLTGVVNENKTDFSTYSTDALNNSKLLNKLYEENYSTNIYETELIWDDKKSTKIDNVMPLHSEKNGSKIVEYVYFKEQTKYILFKYLPFSLKKVSHVEKMDFLRANSDLFHSDNIENYKALKNQAVNKIDEKYFQFLHIDGAHVPFDLDSNVNRIENGTYNQKVQAMLKIIEVYLDRLKNNDVYDNSVIIIMADHGYSYAGLIGRQNPILFIKGIDEHHEMISSDIPVSQLDYVDAYLDLLDGKKSTDLFDNIDNNRERRYLLYEYTKEDHMIEYLQKGKAWDEETLVPTGKEFNR
ncbi:MAG: sulfatase-like hydrolase/transferase [Bacilli bacterium]|nr:sulfatase-like hydrolase/transferase [Bacilli bacterium]